MSNITPYRFVATMSLPERSPSVGVDGVFRWLDDTIPSFEDLGRNIDQWVRQKREELERWTRENWPSEIPWDGELRQITDGWLRWFVRKVEEGELGDRWLWWREYLPPEIRELIDEKREEFLERILDLYRRQFPNGIQDFDGLTEGWFEFIKRAINSGNGYWKFFQENRSWSEYWDNPHSPIRALRRYLPDVPWPFSGLTNSQHAFLSGVYSQNNGLGNSNAWRPIWYSAPGQETFGPGWVRRSDGTIGWPTERSAGINLQNSFTDAPRYGPFYPLL